jgi:hypothetical protein
MTETQAAKPPSVDAQASEPRAAVSWQGIKAMLHATAVLIATSVFLPGVLVRVACQEIATRTSGMRVERQDFVTELGGEIEHLGGVSAWTGLMVATIVGPLLIGSALLTPFVVRWALLDVRPFASTSANNPSVLLTHSTSALPFLEASQTLGFTQALRLWFGISCFYCSIPSSVILEGARRENAARSWRSPLKLVLTPVTLFYRGVRAIDAMLTYVLADAYIASGLIILALSWRALSALSTLLI